MSTGNTSTASTVARQRRPAWLTALIALAVLFALSEVAYLLFGMSAQNCLDNPADCRNIMSWLFDKFFVQTANGIGLQVLVVKTSLGLPGFNNIFYLVLGSVLTDEPMQFLATMAASLLVGFLALWGYLATSAGRGVGMRLLLAVIFALGWFVLYNNTEASVYRADFFATAMQRYLEIPVTFLSVLIVSVVARR